MRERIILRSKLDDAASSGSSLDAYKPSPEQRERANVLKRLVTNLERAGAAYSITGGYGLDGLYGALTRDHDDIDILTTLEDTEKARKIIRASGFHIDIIKMRGNVEVYEHERTRTKLELSPITKLTDYSDTDTAEFLPSTPNASLDAVAFRAPTLKGQEEIARIQVIRAQEGGWGPYAHIEWKSRIVSAIKKRFKEQ